MVQASHPGKPVLRALPTQNRAIINADGPTNYSSGAISTQRRGLGTRLKFSVVRWHMVFKSSCEIVGLREHLKDISDMEFHFDSPIAAVVQLSKKYSDGREPADASSVVFLGTTTGEIEDKRCAADIHAALSSPVDGRWANFRNLDESRRFAAWAAVDRFFEPLRGLIASTISIFRWRSGLSEGLSDPYRNRGEYLSQDGESWIEIHMARSLKSSWVLAPRQIEASPGIEDQVVGLIAEKGEEPLGHQLFREAWNQRSSHPRSALVIGVAAAEVGLKKLIGTLVPEAQWLVDEIQTPSFDKMVRKYLPSLPIKARFHGKKITPPGALIKRLDRAVKCRNKVVHAGEPPPQSEELEEMLRAVDDFLWICDAYAGHLWVAEYISTETRAAWENE
jgi:hypothetical protein